MNIDDEYKKLSYMLGYTAEALIALLFNKRGFQLIEHRYKNQNHEIDLIMCKHEMRELLFAEVKFRSNSNYALDYINYKECKKIYHSAECFLSNNGHFSLFAMKFKLCIVGNTSLKIIDMQC